MREMRGAFYECSMVLVRVGDYKSKRAREAGIVYNVANSVCGTTSFYS
jgi:hypothetical protein